MSLPQPFNAIDLTDKTTGRAHELKAAGVKYVGYYGRLDRADPAEIEGLHSVGIKVWHIVESGYPTSDAYFNEAQGIADAHKALQFAWLTKQPTGTTLSPAVDYNPSTVAIEGCITDYMGGFRSVVKHDFLLMPYSSGKCCRMLVDVGLAHFGWRSQSTSFDEFDWAGASIKQGPAHDVLGFGADLNYVIQDKVTW
jgi:hypothetical protein